MKANKRLQLLGLLWSVLVLLEAVGLVEATLARRPLKSAEEIAREKAEDREKFLKQNRATRASKPPKPKRAKIDAKPVFAIDLGTESTRVVVVDPNNEAMMYDMTVNELSNRKTPTAFGYDAQTRQVLTGEAAKALYFRTPSNALLGLKRLIGQSFDSPHVQTFREDHPYATLARGAENFIEFKAAEDAEASFGVEEMVGFLYQASRAQAESYVHVEGLTDCILTVPAYYSVRQREAISHIASLAGFQHVSLINELTAVAIDYSSRNTFEEPRRVVFFDIGSHAASASLVELSNPSKGSVKVKVLASATNHELNGYKFDTILTNILADEFDVQHKGLKASIRTSPRAMAKLRNEAQSVKEQLSASNLVKLEMDALHEGKDFKTTVKRDVFEEKSAALFGLAPALLAAVLEQSGLKPEDISALEYFGGGVRVPKLQSTLQEKYPSIPAGQHVNGEEAAVFGAGIYLATIKKWNPYFQELVVEDLPASTLNEGDHAQPSEERLKKVKEHFDRLVERQREHAAMIVARNQLESYVYETKENLDEILKGAPEEEVERAREHLSSVVDWMDEVVEAEATAQGFEEKLQEAQKVVGDVKAPIKPSKPKKTKSRKEEL